MERGNPRPPPQMEQHETRTPADDGIAHAPVVHKTWNPSRRSMEQQNRRFAKPQLPCTIAAPQSLENAVLTAMRNSVELLSMREVTCWRW